MAPLIVLLVFVGGAILYSESLKARTRVGDEVPSFELPSLHGDTVRIEDYQGNPVVVNFWATWCPSCREEMPAHEAFFRRYGDRIGYLAINERETSTRIERHRDEVERAGLTMTFPILLDKRGTVADIFRLGGVPETWLIDDTGIARHHWAGPITFEQLEAAYQEVTGTTIDAADGGPFHGDRTALAVLAVPRESVVSGPLDPPTGDLELLYVAGDDGLALYELHRGGAEADDFEWHSLDGETVLVLTREDGYPDRPSSEELDRVDLVRESQTVQPLIVTSRGLPGLPAAPVSLATDSGGRRLAWVPQYGLYEDTGSGWRQLASNLPLAMPWGGLGPDPFTPDHWLIATPGGLMETRNGGRTWRATGVTQRTYAVAFDPSTPRRIYIATDTGVWVSDDGGRTAERLPGSPQRVLPALDVVTGHEGATVLVTAAPNGDVYAGMAAGTHWKRIVPLQQR